MLRAMGVMLHALYPDEKILVNYSSLLWLIAVIAARNLEGESRRVRSVNGGGWKYEILHNRLRRPVGRANVMCRWSTAFKRRHRFPFVAVAVVAIIFIVR